MVQAEHKLEGYADGHLPLNFSQGLFGASLLPSDAPYTDETARIALENVDVVDSFPSFAVENAFVNGMGSFRQV